MMDIDSSSVSSTSSPTWRMMLDVEIPGGAAAAAVNDEPALDAPPAPRCRQ
jgi:hypothetical protein